MPRKATDDVLEDDGAQNVRVFVLNLELPFAEVLLLVTGSDVNGVSLLSLFEDLLGPLVSIFAVELGCDQMDLILIGDGEEALVHAWAPLNRVNDLVRKLVLANLLA